MCSVRGCSRNLYGKQEVCHYHYQVNRRTDVRRPQCLAEGCPRPGISKKMCPAHFKRFKTYGDMFNDIPLGNSGRMLIHARLVSKAPIGFSFCYACNNYLDHILFKNNLYYCTDCVRWTAIYKKYKITQKDFEKMFKTQGNKCKICKTSESGGRGVFVVDHCHKTNKIRGILCHQCNANLVGSINKDNLPRIVKYLYPHISIGIFKEFVKIEPRKGT